ncbi:MAG: hypothetical protein ACQERC_13405 [Bacteroidota bacterium]
MYNVVKMLCIVVLSVHTASLHAQVVSQFDFDSNPVTTATIGPNASSISSSATSSPGGIGGTNGLNAGLPKMDIDMVVPGSPTFDVNGIDVSFYFQRDENVAQFIERGQSLRISGANNLSVRYRVEDGGGGFNTVNSGNIYAIPNDNTMRQYRFIYTPCDGVGVFMVDNTVIWTNDGPDNRNMYWNGAGDLEIGRQMDGTGFNRTMLDHIVIGSVECTPLPVEFLDVAATPEDDRSVYVEWATGSESDNSHFEVERRTAQHEWMSIGTVEGAGNSSQRIEYAFLDHKAAQGINYYRIKQVDFDGQHAYSPIVAAQLKSTEMIIEPGAEARHFLITIGTAEEKAEPDEHPLQIYSSQGKLIYTIPHNSNSTHAVDLSRVRPGIYVAKWGEKTQRFMVD